MMLWYLAFCYAISFYIQLWIATVAFLPRWKNEEALQKEHFLALFS